jgi:mono/diheme cytochrome c family protein
MIRHHRMTLGRELAGIGALATLCLVQMSCNVYYAPWEEACIIESDDIDLPPRPLVLDSTVQAATPPPPISGGTLAMSPSVTSEPTWIVAADPDGDSVHITRLDLLIDVRRVSLNTGDEPGRVIVDDSQRAHVALRRGGAVVTIDLATATILGRHAVCPAPRGLAFDSQNGSLLVACKSGELITLNPLTGAVLDEQRLEVGLRDVIIDRVDPNTIYVTLFRTAEVLVLDRQGRIVERMKPPALETTEIDFATGVPITSRFEPAVAWRTVAAQNGGVVMAHQRARAKGVSVSRGGYGGNGCEGGVVHGAVTPLRPGVAATPTQARTFAVLPVDLALANSAGSDAVVVAAGNVFDGFFAEPAAVRVPVNEPHDQGCRPRDRDFDTQQSQAVATAVSADLSTVVIQLRDPARLAIHYNTDSTRAPEFVTLDSVRHNDNGHTIFHMNSGSGISCASCHPEGGDDARVWEFDCLGPRRTQSLHVGLSGTEPFHWSGDMASFDMLMDEVFTGRMGGAKADPAQVDALASWLDTLQPPPRASPVDTAAVERGRQIFQSPAVGCESCHNGAKLTNNQSFDVGTGGTFQVPSLIGIAYRGPFIHTGCAPTLRDRFSNPGCGGGDKHGVVSSLTAQEIDDLVAYLETL